MQGHDFIKELDAKTRREKHRNAARNKLLRLLSRSKLERLSELERPWLADTKTLMVMVRISWPSDEIESQLKSIFETAK